MSIVATVAVERKKLYEQVWSVPASKLALLYGISDVGLAKACKRYNIPRPPRGYWARIAAGQRVRRPALPQRDHSDELVYLKGWDMPDEAVQKLISETRTPASGTADAGIAELHKTAAAIQQRLLEVKPDSEGLLTVTASGLEVRVSPPLVGRAVAVLDTLMKRWEARSGSEISLNADGGGSTQPILAIGPDGFGLRLLENVEDSRPVSDPTRLKGTLSLFITGDENRQFRRRWSDTKSQRLEKLIGPALETVATALALKCQERLDAECIMRQRKTVEAARSAASRDATRELYSRQELMQNVARWHDARRIRDYLAELKRAIDSGRCRPSDEKQFQAWFAWAQRLADSIDPIIAGPLPEGKPASRRNVPVAELDLTRASRAAIERLAVADTDGLWTQKEDAIRAACEGKFGPVWNEITRVLEGLHYDVSKRKEAYEWS